MTVRGGDSRCSVQQCSAPVTPEMVKGFVIVIVNVIVIMIVIPSICSRLGKGSKQQFPSC